MAEPITHEALRTVPTQVLITTADRAIDPDLQWMMAARTDAAVIEIDASHAVMLSQPDAVAELIARAAHTPRTPSITAPISPESRAESS